MKAIVQEEYGSLGALKVQEVEQPAPGDDEVLVRVRAASVHPDVWHVVCGRPYVLRLMGAGFFKPKNPIPGTDMAGVVEAVGKNVTQFRPGDEVFGETIGSMQWINGGAFAEYVTVAEECLARKPANITFEQAASVPTSGYIALLNLGEVGQLGPGQEVLVNGAGGGVGALALQLAKAYGARVTAVDSTKKLGLLRALGADQVIDYTRENFTKGGVRYDLIFDIPGNYPFSECKRALTPRWPSFGSFSKPAKSRRSSIERIPSAGPPRPSVISWRVSPRGESSSPRRESDRPNHQVWRNPCAHSPRDAKLSPALGGAPMITNAWRRHASCGIDPHGLPSRHQERFG
jgi:NADPH:quinone reductase-like Zn-dependent oxidoreductase